MFHTLHLFLDFTQTINSLLRFRTKIFPGENTDVFTPVEVNEPVGHSYTFSTYLKTLKPLARRALLTFADDDLIKAIVECAINTLNGNHKLTKEDKGKLSKYNNRLRAW